MISVTDCMCPEDESGLDPTHPRYVSLNRRKRLAEGFRTGIVVPEGLIAHGRGEMFDYLLGEVTLPPALIAEKASAAALLTAKKPVISVNGNTAALCPEGIIDLAKAASAKIEVNLFHWSNNRALLIKKHLTANGAKDVIAENPDAVLEGIHHDRGKCHIAGIYSADVVLIPLEDGDRAQALVDMGKTVISIDLNPLSRTSLCASISIVDELNRALPNISRFARELSKNKSEAMKILDGYDNFKGLRSVYHTIHTRFYDLARSQ